MENGGEWVKVTRKHKGSKYSVQENGTRFNADSWDNGALWKMFSSYGKVIDVYVAFKRTKRDTRFGFVRFINIGDILSFESKLEGIMIGAEKLIINRAKFTKVGDKGVPVSEFPLFMSGSRPLPRV
ncbi:nucleotide-binding alpha-beta plait domain-containing protein [Tanacetum coccineum]